MASAVDAAPLVVFGGGAVLGLVTRRGRLVLALVVLALADCALVSFRDHAIFAAVALLLPLNLAVIAWLGEDKPLTGRGAVLFALAMLQAGVVALLQRPEMADVARSLLQPMVAPNFSVWTALPQSALFAFLGALAVVLARLTVERRPLVVAAAWALVACFLALDDMSSGVSANVHLAAAGLLLVAGASWKAPRAARLDDATGLPPSFELTKTLQQLPRRYALASVEIDEFVAFRQTHGPDGARRMLRLVAKALKRMGGGDPFYCGGAMFTIVFRGSSAPRAARYLDAARLAVEASTLELSVSDRGRGAAKGPPGSVKRTVSVTLSGGVAATDKPGADPYEVMQAAERALARARHAGMNRVSA